MDISKRTLIGFALGLSIIFIVTLLSLIYVAEKRITLHHAKIMSEMVVQQVDMVRKIYFRDVVGKLKKDGYGAHPKYKTKKGFVPIPATLITRLGEESKKKTTNN